LSKLRGGCRGYHGSATAKQDRFRIYILVIQDLFTKGGMPRTERPEASCNKLILSRWDIPKFLLTDNVTEFLNATNICRGELSTSTYHPQVNPVERINGVLKMMIISFLDRDPQRALELRSDRLQLRV